MVQRMATSDNEWQRVTTDRNEQHRVIQQVTTNENEWEQVKVTLGVKMKQMANLGRQIQVQVDEMYEMDQTY